MSRLRNWVKLILVVGIFLGSVTLAASPVYGQTKPQYPPAAQPGTLTTPTSLPTPRKLEIIPVPKPVSPFPQKKPDTLPLVSISTIPDPETLNSASALQPPTVPKEEIERAVKEFLKAQEEKKKREEEVKKKEEAKGHVVGSDLVFKAFWSEDGLTFQTANEDFYIHVGGRFSVDAAWFGAGQELQTGQGGVGELEDGALFRRGRVRIEGTMYENFSWISEFALDAGIEDRTNHPGFLDVYGEINHLPWIGNFRAGHFREPFSMEALSSGNGLAFMERSSGFEALAPFRNIGIMIYNTAFEEHMTLATGLFRANSRNTGNPFDTGDGEYSSTSRITFLPWYEQDGRCLLHLGVAYSHRSFSTAPGQDQARFRSFDEVRVGGYVFADSGFLTVESTDLLGLELACNYGPWCLQGEYYNAWVQDAWIAGQSTHPHFHGGYVQVSYFLTGENRTYDKTEGVLERPQPYENFFFIKKDAEGTEPRSFLRGRGAWETGIRYSWVDVNDPGQGINAQFAQDVTFGLNWYLNPNARIQWNYIIIDRDFPSQDNSGVAHIFATRFHMDF